MSSTSTPGSTFAAEGRVPSGTVYLSAADRQGEVFMHDDMRRRIFETSLLNNILFEEGVVMPDVFFFVSEGIWQHTEAAIRKGRRSLLEVAVENGLAYGAFRDPSSSTFTDAYEVVKDQGIRGLLDNNRCRLLVDRLGTAASRGLDNHTYHNVFWPNHSVGDKFEERLSHFFDSDSDPDTDVAPVMTGDIPKLWEQTREWRTTYLNDARSMRQTGFRRGDYLQILGQAAGLQGPIDDVGDIIRAIEAPRREAMRALLFWMNECYQINQAMEFNAIPNVINFDTQLSTATLAGLAAPRGAENAVEIIREEITAKMPPPEVLLGLDPSKLIEIRKKPAAETYFATLRRWRESPEDSGLTDDVKELFKIYAKTISEAAWREARYSESPLKLQLAKLSGPVQPTIAVATSVAAAASLTSDPRIAPLCIAAGTAYAAYVWVRDHPRSATHSLNAVRYRPEVNLPGAAL